MSLNRKTFFTAVVFLTLFAGVIFFVSLPLVATIKNINAEIAEQRQKIAIYDSRISKTREFEAFARQEKDMDNLSRVFVDGQMPLDFINSLETAARDVGVTIKLSSSLSQSVRANVGGWPSISIEAELSGQIPGILRFVKKIENSPYLVEIQSFNIEAGAPRLTGENSTAGETGAGNAHILMNAYAKSQ